MIHSMLMQAAPSTFELYFPYRAVIQVLVVGIIYGTGIPTLYAFGLKIYALGSSADTCRDICRTPQSSQLAQLYKFIAYLFFAFCAFLVIVGILYITKSSIDNYLHINIDTYFHAPW